MIDFANVEKALVNLFAGSEDFNIMDTLDISKNIPDLSKPVLSFAVTDGSKNLSEYFSCKQQRNDQIIILVAIANAADDYQEKTSLAMENFRYDLISQSAVANKIAESNPESAGKVGRIGIDSMSVIENFGGGSLVNCYALVKINLSVQYFF